MMMVDGGWVVMRTEVIEMRIVTTTTRVMIKRIHNASPAAANSIPLCYHPPPLTII